MAAVVSLLLLLASQLTSTTAAIPSARWSGPALVVSNTRLSLAHDCVHASYYGAYGGLSSRQDHVYLVQGECAEAVPYSDLLQSVSEHGAVVDLPPKWEADGRLVWVGRAGVQSDEERGGAERRQDMRRSATSMSGLIGQSSQLLLGAAVDKHKHLAWPIHSTPDSFLLHVPVRLLAHLDTFLPAHLVPVALPLSPLPTSAWDPVPEKYAKHLANLTRQLAFDPVIDRIVSDGLKLDDLRRNVRWLTGEAPSGIESRHSFTDGAVKAAHWLKGRSRFHLFQLFQVFRLFQLFQPSTLPSTPALPCVDLSIHPWLQLAVLGEPTLTISGKVEDSGAECHLHDFLQGFAPNVVCHYPSNATERVILSAHYDSRGSFGLTRAPGGDDDASGSGHLLAIASAIKSQGIAFDKSVYLVFFAGEEQGLLGSHAYAEWCHANNITVLLQVQADMLGYHDADEPVQLGLPESIHLPEATHLLANLSSLYSPELVVGSTPACCSDHQSFLAYGFPSTQVFERNGWIIDPMYHNSGDLSQRVNYDFEQIIAIGRVTMAALLTVAGYRVEATA